MASFGDTNDLCTVDDIFELNIQDEKEVLDIIKERMSLGFLYTRIGENMLIVMKPSNTRSPIIDVSVNDKNFGQKFRESLSAAVSMVNKVLQVSMNYEAQTHAHVLYQFKPSFVLNLPMTLSAHQTYIILYLILS